MIRHAARMSVELGATILKLPAPSDSKVLTEIVEHTGVPVWVLGGAPSTGGGIGPAIVNWIEAGATGVAIGRNVWGRPGMDTAVQGLRAAVYDRDAARAEKLFNAADEEP
jgi:DhnA family fructose-bisphosphate aldolase class Ia